MKNGNRPKMRFLHLFCNRFAYIGGTLILLSVIINLCEASISKHFAPFVISLVAGIMSTIGTALLIGAIFDLAKNSQEFVESVAEILSDIVVSKSFLKTLSETDKRQALELILQPSGDQLQQYSNINQYFQNKIDEMVEMFDTNFKSHLSLSVSVYKDQKDGIVKARSMLQYRIYKINNEYKPIQTWFEHEGSTFVSTKIICGKKVIDINKEKLKPISEEENRIEKPYTKTYFEIPKEYQDAPYVTVEYDILEPGYDHWINYTWTSLTPYDGLNFSLTCHDDLVIKDHILFDDGDGYTVEKSEDKKSITILATGWLNRYTGLSIVIGEKNEADEKERAEEKEGEKTEGA